MRTNKLSLRQPEQELQYNEMGEPLPTIQAAHHIRPHGYPIAIGMHGGYQPPVTHTLAVREKDVITQPIDSENKTAAKSAAYYGKQNYWHQDRLAYLVPGTAASTGPITN
jgi:hypothetical protein